MVDYSLPTKFDRLVHNPSRLAIISVLAGCESADFTYLLNVTELNKGTLSKQLTALEDGGYIEIQKTFRNKRPNTSAQLTAEGRKAFQEYRKEYKRFIDSLD